MPKPLVIVESPTKARTIAGFLGRDYAVESSIGHIRDLPRNAAEVPAAYKGEPWARLGVDTENDFKPLYVVPQEKKGQIQKLKQLVKDAPEVFLATDEDREGESIAWHLLEVLAPKVPVRRMVFHEITPEAIEHAIANSRDLDRRLVDAQEARRILDRLYGYELSPVLWKIIRPKLSAGRVQSPAVRILVERERERIEFRAAGWWDLEATFATLRNGDQPFTGTLVAVDGVRLATGRDFAPTGEQIRDEVVRLDEEGARSLAGDLEGCEFSVRSVETKPWRRSPAAPFRTSTLQQEAGRKLRFSSSRTMQVAQRLYENGYITYMRTDSTTLSDTAVTAARSLVGELYGADFLPTRPRTYEKKVRNAQEAHEAIRPAGERFHLPEEVESSLGADEARLYDLIWKRTVASQMVDATGESVAARVGALSRSGRDAEFASSGLVITFPGFMRAYVEGSDDPDAELGERERRLPPLAAGDPVTAEDIDAAGHETKPPARYTEASLVRRLEELGIGRPSTYASIISTIQERGYAWKKGTALVPSFTAFATVTLLELHFPDLIDFAFTARMEDDLDQISRGEMESIPWLSSFYFGNGRPGLRHMVSDHLAEIDARTVNSIPLGVDEHGTPVVARVGRYGPFVQRGDDTAAIPEDLAPDELSIDKAAELLSAPSGDRQLGTDPESGLAVIARSGRFGPYVQLGEGGEGTPKPRTASLFRSMSLDTVTLAEALRLLTLPRVVGSDPAGGEEITALNGRYGPYLKRGSETRSLDREEQLFTVTVAEALALFAQPKQRGRAAAPLKELGEDPASGKAVTVRSGRYGPYVTDGETNASLRQNDDPQTITMERALDLLAERRAKAGTSSKPAARKPAKPARKTARKPAGKTARKPAGKTARKPAGKTAEQTAKKTAGKAAKKAAPKRSRKTP